MLRRETGDGSLSPFLLTQFGKTDKIKHKKKQHIDRERGIIDASYCQEKEL